MLVDWTIVGFGQDTICKGIMFFSLALFLSCSLALFFIFIFIFLKNDSTTQRKKSGKSSTTHDGDGGRGGRKQAAPPRRRRRNRRKAAFFLSCSLAPCVSLSLVHLSLKESGLGHDLSSIMISYDRA